MHGRVLAYDNYQGDAPETEAYPNPGEMGTPVESLCIDAVLWSSELHSSAGCAQVLPFQHSRSELDLQAVYE